MVVCQRYSQKWGTQREPEVLTRGVTLGIMQTPKPTKAGGSDFCLAREFTKRGVWQSSEGSSDGPMGTT